MVLLDFSMSPLGKGESVAPYVARCLEIVAASGLDYRLHAMGTTLEGEWDEVFAVVRRCFETLRVVRHVVDEAHPLGNPETDEGGRHAA